MQRLSLRAQPGLISADKQSEPSYFPGDCHITWWAYGRPDRKLLGSLEPFSVGFRTASSSGETGFDAIPRWRLQRPQRCRISNLPLRASPSAMRCFMRGLLSVAVVPSLGVVAARRGGLPSCFHRVWVGSRGA